MTDQDLIRSLQGKDRRDYLLTKMFRVYRDAETEICGHANFAVINNDRFIAHPAMVLSKYETHLTSEAAAKNMGSEKWGDKIMEIIVQLENGDFSNDPIRSEYSVLAMYVK